MLIIKILFVLLFSATSVLANSEDSFNSEPLLLAENLTRDQAAKNLQDSINARVLGAKTIQKEGKNYYVFKVLTEKDGRVRQITIDPATGQTISK